MRRALLVLLVAACGHSGLPPPGDYKPNPTPEPVTKCPKEYKAAKAAREQLVGETSPELREAAAKASFAHGECERALFDAMTLEADSDEEFRAGVDALKTQAYTVQNLYQEAANYDVPAWTVGGYTRLGDLYGAYAKKLRNTQPGASADPQLRAMWFQEIDDIAAKVDAQAAQYWEKALDVVEMGPAAFAAEERIAAWARRSCIGLRATDPGLSAKHQMCSP